MNFCCINCQRQAKKGTWRGVKIPDSVSFTGPCSIGLLWVLTYLVSSKSNILVCLKTILMTFWKTFKSQNVFKTLGIEEISYSHVTFSRSLCLEEELLKSHHLNSYIFNIHVKCNLKKCSVKACWVFQWSNYIINVIKKRKKFSGCLAYTVPTKMSSEVHTIWSGMLFVI